MKKFRNFPAIITLLAGFITSVVMILNKYTLVKFLWVLVLVMAGFYIAGLLIRILLNRVFKDEEKQDEQNGEHEAEDTQEKGKKEGQDDVKEDSEGKEAE